MQLGSNHLQYHRQRNLPHLPTEPASRVADVKIVVRPNSLVTTLPSLLVMVVRRVSVAIGIRPPAAPPVLVPPPPLRAVAIPDAAEPDPPALALAATSHGQ